MRKALDMPDIHFKCPKCNQKLAAPEELSNQSIECPTCKERIELPIHNPFPELKETLRRTELLAEARAEARKGTTTTPEATRVRKFTLKKPDSTEVVLDQDGLVIGYNNREIDPGWLARPQGSQEWERVGILIGVETSPKPQGSPSQTPTPKPPETKNEQPFWHDPKIGSIVALILVIIFALWLFMSHSTTRDAVVDWIRSLFHGE